MTVPSAKARIVGYSRSADGGITLHMQDEHGQRFDIVLLNSDGVVLRILGAK